jgi:hypothetical protein
MKMIVSISLSTLLAAACAADDGAPSTVSKDEARDLAKADSFRDFCAEFDWYGDGVCDDFCLQRDPDCATDERTPELGDDPSVALTSKMSMSEGLAIAEAEHGPTIEAKFELGDDGKLALSVYPTTSLELDSERNVFQEQAGDPTHVPWQSTLEQFHDQEHLTRSSRDLTLVQLSRYTLPEVVEELEELGMVYWAIPTIQEGRAGYGVYFLLRSDDEDEAQSVYLFADGGGDWRGGVEDLGTGPDSGATDARTPELGNDPSVLGQARISMSDALRQIAAEHGPAIEAKYELDGDGRLSLSIYPVGEDISVDAQRQRFFELAGDPTAATFNPERSEFVVPDEEHLTRSARDLTLVQTADLTLLEAVEEAEEAVPGGFVFWAIPTIRGTRSGYGVYVYGADGRSHYLFIS